MSTSTLVQQTPQVGVQPGDGCLQFTLWAPLKEQVTLHLLSPESRAVELERDREGYWRAQVEGVEPGTLYQYEIDGDRYPDPASLSQPEGVHGPSEVVAPQQFDWQDQDWQGLSLAEMVIYELHVGCFTAEGTFEAVIDRLDDLKALGVNTIELMPVAEFPGDSSKLGCAHRNWGYDGTFPFAAQSSYGGVAGIQKLVDACHQKGMAIILDVVYNHLGPEGNYLWHYGTYFTDKYKTPWGSAVNYDDIYSPAVRGYVLQNVRYWLETCHFDGLRLDAIHAIYDFGAKSIFEEMSELVQQLSGPRRWLIAESDLNDPRIIRPIEKGGHGLDAQWCDDFHHAVHSLLTGEGDGYYQDFGKLDHLAKAYEKAFVYGWDYSAHRRRYHGAPAKGCGSEQFVVCVQNHDQVGNRMMGDRFSHLLDFESQKLAAAALLLSPYVPMLFMGEEYGETAPFQYFVSLGDEGLIESVREGRKVEFADFQGEAEPPDPQDPATFERSKLNWELRQQPKHQQLWELYRYLIQLRKTDPVLAELDRQHLEAAVDPAQQVLKIARVHGDQSLLAFLNFSEAEAEVHLSLQPGTYHLVLDSSSDRWAGPGSSLPDCIPQQRQAPISQQSLVLPPRSAVVYSTTRSEP